MGLGRFCDSGQSHKSANSLPSPQTGAEPVQKAPGSSRTSPGAGGGAGQRPRTDPPTPSSSPLACLPRALDPQKGAEDCLFRADLGSQTHKVTFQEKDGVKGLIRAFTTRKDSSSLKQKELISSRNEWF